MGEDGATHRVRYAADVRQAPAQKSAKLYTATPGKLVTQMGDLITLGDGSRCVPLEPRGWIDAEALEPEAAVERPEQSLPDAVQAAVQAHEPECEPDATAAERRFAAGAAAGTGAGAGADVAGVAATADGGRSAPLGSAPGADASAPSARARVQANLLDGSEFRVVRPAEVRQAPSQTSPILHVAAVGRLVKQMGSVVTLENAVRRVPLLPRGWIDADALEALVDNAEDQWGAKPMSSKSEGARSSVISQSLLPKPIKGRVLELASDGRQVGPKTRESQQVSKNPSGAQSPSKQQQDWTSTNPNQMQGREEITGRGSRGHSSSLQAGDRDDAQTKAKKSPEYIPVLKVNLAEGLKDSLPRPPQKMRATAAEFSPQTIIGAATEEFSQQRAFTPQSEIESRNMENIIEGSLQSFADHAAAPPETSWAELDEEICQQLALDSGVADRAKSAERIRLVVAGLLRTLEVSGDVMLFGSFTTGFKSSSSDLDMVYSGSIESDQVVALLARLSVMLPECGFDNITKIFNSSIPLVKFTDIKSGIEVDFCMSNELGVRNSSLLDAYCQFDERVVQVGRLVKDWAKRHELVGTADGCLNSYAYMLLTIHYLQSLEPYVVPNLQALASNRPSVPVKDRKWGTEDTWETRFKEDWKALPPSWNKQTTAELIVGFFYFYVEQFDWSQHAVCIRLNTPGSAIDKYTLATTTSAEQWYIEDPFDLKHNLGGRCSAAGRQRILDEMRRALDLLYNLRRWREVCPPGTPDIYYLKCRVSPATTADHLINEFREYGLTKVYRCVGQVYLEFPSSTARRRAHSKNEIYVEDCQLHLHYCSWHGVSEAAIHGRMEVYDVPEVTTPSGEADVAVNDTLPDGMQLQ